jgi:hypothetical protein
MRHLFTKKRTIALVVVGSLVVAGGAVAYFTSTGSGTGNATVGSASNWVVTTSAPTGGALYPGTGSDVVAYNVQNASTGYQNLAGTTAALTTDTAGGVYDTTSKAFVDGCQASWFTVVNSDTGTPVDLAGGTSYTAGYATITMQDSGTNQNPCQGLTPQVTINAS